MTDASVVPTGNTYDKYGSTNRIERALMSGFFSAIERGLPSDSPARVLEAGLGEGEVSSRLAERWPAAPIMGIDLPDPELADEWTRAGLAGAFADITRLPFPDRSFDLVLAIEVLEHVEDPHAALRELIRVSTDRLVLSVPREPVWRAANVARGKYLGDLGNTPGHILHWSTRRFRALVGAYAEVDQVLRPFPWTVVTARRRG